MRTTRHGSPKPGGARRGTEGGERLDEAARPRGDPRSPPAGLRPSRGSSARTRRRIAFFPLAAGKTRDLRDLGTGRLGRARGTPQQTLADPAAAMPGAGHEDPFLGTDNRKEAGTGGAPDPIPSTGRRQAGHRDAPRPRSVSCSRRQRSSASGEAPAAPVQTGRLAGMLRARRRRPDDPDRQVPRRVLGVRADDGGVRWS